MGRARKLASHDRTGSHASPCQLTALSSSTPQAASVAIRPPAEAPTSCTLLRSKLRCRYRRQPNSHQKKTAQCRSQEGRRGRRHQHENHEASPCFTRTTVKEGSWIGQARWTKSCKVKHGETGGQATHFTNCKADWTAGPHMAVAYHDSPVPLPGPTPTHCRRQQRTGSAAWQWPAPRASPRPPTAGV